MAATNNYSERIILLICKLGKRIMRFAKFNLWIFILVTVVFISVGTLMFLFNSPSSLGIVNYAFAIVGGLSGLCFSWARNFNDNDEKITQIKILELGEILLFSGILFLFSSAMAYLKTFGIVYLSVSDFVRILTLILSWLAFVLRIIAFCMFCISIVEVCGVILKNILSRS